MPPMLPQPLALACACSRAARGEPTGRGPRDMELKLASARPQVPSRPLTTSGSLAPGQCTRLRYQNDKGSRSCCASVFGRASRTAASLMSGVHTGFRDEVLYTCLL